MPRQGALIGLPFAWAWKYRENRKSVGLWRKISSFSLFRLLLVNVSSHFSHAGSMSCQSAVAVGGCPVSSWAGVKARRSQAGRVHVRGVMIPIFFGIGIGITYTTMGVCWNQNHKCWNHVINWNQFHYRDGFHLQNQIHTWNQFHQ